VVTQTRTFRLYAEDALACEAWLKALAPTVSDDELGLDGRGLDESRGAAPNSFPGAGACRHLSTANRGVGRAATQCAGSARRTRTALTVTVTLFVLLPVQVPPSSQWQMPEDAANAAGAAEDASQARARSRSPSPELLGMLPITVHEPGDAEGGTALNRGDRRYWMPDDSCECWRVFPPPACWALGGARHGGQGGPAMEQAGRGAGGACGADRGAGVGRSVWGCGGAGARWTIHAHTR
jgi:hypothetical protein